MLQVEDEDHKEFKTLAANNGKTIPQMLTRLLNLTADDILEIVVDVKNQVEETSEKTHSANVKQALEQPILSLEALIAEIKNPTQRRRVLK